MPGHLLLVVTTVILLGIGLFWVGGKLWNGFQSRVARVVLLLVSCVLALPGVLYTLYYSHLFDRATWFYNLRIFPFSELFACGLGLLAGIIFAHLDLDSTVQKCAIPVGLAIFLSVPYLKPLLDPVDLESLKTNCAGEVCLQSTPSTCGPNSVATILKLLGDAVSERQIAQEAFTSHSGTEIWYLARVLQHRGFSTKVIQQVPSELNPPVPSVAGVVLPGGVGHFIAVTRRDGDRFVLADPLKGKIEVQHSDLAATYHFTGFFLAVTKNGQND
ncbi:MAG TPA: cysteine peptidase family C39 domain-containing protein [Candidatus Acidoferrum sp.]|nr:cysteine peptidase family C39 domain-containing protein [Candidatus Acidoferrum sp.]